MTEPGVKFGVYSHTVISESLLDVTRTKLDWAGVTCSLTSTEKLSRPLMNSRSGTKTPGIFLSSSLQNKKNTKSWLGSQPHKTKYRVHNDTDPSRQTYHTRSSLNSILTLQCVVRLTIYNELVVLCTFTTLLSQIVFGKISKQTRMYKDSP